MTVLDELTCEAIALARNDSRAVLGIAGNPGAGKSTLVELLLSRIAAIKGEHWVAHVPMDGFHLADAQLDRVGNRDPVRPGRTREIDLTTMGECQEQKTKLGGARRPEVKQSTPTC